MLWLSSNHLVCVDLTLEMTDTLEMSDCKHSSCTKKTSRDLSFHVFFFPCNLIGEMPGAEAELDGISPRAWDYCETQPEAGMTSERPDIRLNSFFQVGRITSGFTRRWSRPENQSHTVVHSSPKVQTLIVLTDWTCMLSPNCHRASFFSLHT